MKFYITILSIFLSFNLFSQANTNEIKTLPDCFRSQQKQSFIDKIEQGVVYIEDLVSNTDEPWTVFSDRSGNDLKNKAYGNSLIDKSLGFMEELHVINFKDNWLKVITKRKINGQYLEGWIEAKYLLLSRYSLKIESDIPVPRKEIVLTDLDELKSLGIEPDSALDLRNFYSQPNTKADNIIGPAKAFNIYFVLKSIKESVLLSKADVLSGNYETNRPKVLGWMNGSNVRSWNSRVALEPSRSEVAVNEYSNNGKKEYLPGYMALNKLKAGLTTGSFPPNPEVRFKVGEIRNNFMRMPVINVLDSEIKKVVSISRASQGEEANDDEKLINRQLLEVANRQKSKTNIIFAIDATSSMNYYKNEVAQTIDGIIDDNKNLGVSEIKFGVIEYRDYADGNNIEAPTYRAHELTTNWVKTKDIIKNIKCKSNIKDKSKSEAVFHGIINGLNDLNINKSESNILVLVGDCGNLRPDPKKYTIDDVVKVFDNYSINLLSLQVAHKNTRKGEYDDFNDDIIQIISKTAKKKIENKETKLIVKLKPLESENAWDLLWTTKNNDKRDDFQNMFARFIYTNDGEKMPGDFLRKSVRDVIQEYMAVTQKNIRVLNQNLSVGTSTNPNVLLQEPPPGLILHIQRTFNYTKEEAIDYLQSTETTNSAYVSMKYNNSSVNALTEVLYLTDKEKKSLTRSLKKLSSDKICDGHKNQKKCFQENMIEVCKSILGPSTSREIILDLTMNQVWKLLIGAEFMNEKIKDMPIRDFLGLKKKDFNKFYSKFKAKASNFVDNNYVDKNQFLSRRFSLNGSYYYWIPLEDLPGTTK